MIKTKYYDDFLNYFQKAQSQQEKCNVPNFIAHTESCMNDDLMENVELYDVVERKYAGFSQIVNDIFYGWTPEHPYWKRMEAGQATSQRELVANNWTSKNHNLKTWLYLFILHRVTGSAINYGTKPSGYHNTLLFKLHLAENIDDMKKIIKAEGKLGKPFYTSIGYQFPAFPKPTENYKKGGDYFLCEYAPRLAEALARYLETPNKKDLREVGEFMLSWNVENGLRRYAFQYAAVVADIADWFPEYVNTHSMFYYGTNAVECISYLADNDKRLKKELFLDEVMQSIYEDTGSVPYNAEDVCCDYIRWVENYIKPGNDYNHLDFDKVWSSSSIKDHPRGRQKAMLDLGLIETFNGIKSHPSDLKVLNDNNLSVQEYQNMIQCQL
tara:strand:+ start:871 stop:2019 length:1149 start_codon:yes stop_codon:yes gene_type:complete